MEITPEIQAHIDQMLTDAKASWETDVLIPLTAERDQLLQFKPVDKSDAEKALEQREQELFKKEFTIELKANKLEDFVELLNVSNSEELKDKVAQLAKILEARKLNNSYIPSNHKQTDKYEQALKSGNITEAIDVKLSKLFN
ncbi:hypothetical protein KDC22_13255 [Paenibacillus tritici]|uniref:hypothetical protein n=1 Tax=Paenibacillus tritici TaxID=1873425 RepID=UPI001BA5CC30|nr:hypothetical protein [Paenibacillus tritici]QUL57345.1 hypothetical protein KDC22_13255 [Paenibacillus tritici]